MLRRVRRRSSYLAGSWAKMVARCISETPLPTNTLFPWKGLVHPRVQRPSTSENTDTASPGFMTDRRAENIIHTGPPGHLNLNHTDCSGVWEE